MLLYTITDEPITILPHQKIDSQRDTLPYLSILYTEYAKDVSKIRPADGYTANTWVPGRLRPFWVR